jgi:quercetin dioxygenase-like cupin family protein
VRIGHIEDIDAVPVAMEGARGVRMRIAVGEPQGAPNFIMRVFDVEPGGHTPYHAHDFEHEVFILEGRGRHRDEERNDPLVPGDVVFVAPGVEHQFLAADDEGLRFICIVPKG